MTKRRCVLALLACATPMAVLARTLGASASTVEYLYVEANEGNSAGGHVALRIGDQVFDFQNAELGTLRRRRTHWDQFRYVYSVRENRTIHVARVDLSSEDRDAILRRFNRRYLIQNKHFSVWETLRRDGALIDWLLAGTEGAADGHARPPPRLRGAGLFRLDGEATSEGSAGLVALRNRIADERGANYLDHRIRALEREIEALVPTVDASAPFRISDDGPASSVYHFSDRYRDLCEKILALRVLRAAASLHPDVRVVPAGERYALDSMEREQLRSFADAQETRLAGLVSSGRPDWGFALIVGMARLQTLRESEAFGRLRFLDAFRADAPVLSMKSVRGADAFVVELGERARSDFETARAHFLTHGSPSEAQFAWLEERANRDAEFQRGLSAGREVRMQASRLIPERSAEVSGLPRPTVGAAVLRTSARIAIAALDGYEAALRDAFGYRLIDRNCVTELLATLEGGLTDRRTDRVGGGFDFVPFVSYESVVASNPITQKFEVPSYRRTRLDAMYAAENDVAVWLRESNTLTSTIYRPTDRNSFFLFFTEDAGLARPILGVLNLAAAAGEVALGLLRAPFDRGRTAWSGLKGAVFSLPELFFIDLRKGMLDYAPSDPPRTEVRRSV